MYGCGMVFYMTTGEDESAPRPHEAAMRRAMDAYRQGDYGLALVEYHGAYDFAREEPAPTDHELVGQIRAARGVAVCMMRGATFPGDYFVAEEAGLNNPVRYPHHIHYWLTQADKIASELLTDSPDLHEARREAIVTKETLWRYELERSIKKGLAGDNASLDTSVGRAAVVGYDGVWNQFLAYEAGYLDGQPDQNRINMAARRAIANALHGSRRTGWRLAREAYDLGALSESRDLPTSLGNLSDTERARSVSRAKKKAIGAMAVSLCLHRRTALRIAQRIV
jgi:hypothetical protein